MLPIVMYQTQSNTKASFSIYISSKNWSTELDKLDQIKKKKTKNIYVSKLEPKDEKKKGLKYERMMKQLRLTR